MNAPIGIFDSGVGGLTVAGAIAQAFPQEQIIYLGDTAHFPYGEKSAEAIREYSKAIADFLLELGCKLIVIACNSASSAAYPLLQTQVPCPVVDVISPLVDSIARRDFRKVGVIATKATIRSGIYERELLRKCPQVQVASMATPLFAPMIEEGFFGAGDEVSQAVIRRYLSQPDFCDIDALLLACTHYPLIRQSIEQFFGERVQVFDSVDSVVQRVQNLLQEQVGLAAEAARAPHRFLVSDYTSSFEQTAQLFYPEPVRLELVKWHDDRLILV